MQSLSQTEAILKHLRKYKGITSMQAYEMYGATRLSAIIFCLRKKYDIITVMHEGITRYGKPVHYAEYRLMGELKE